MSRPIFDMPDAELDAQLTALGKRLSWAATPDPSGTVLAGLAIPAPLPRRSARRWWLAAAMLALLLGGALLLGSATVRHSLADVLGINGLRIEFGRSETTHTALPVLGTPTTLQDFERALPFIPMQPSLLGDPDAVYLRVLENGEMLGIMAWQPSDILPETSETGLGALLMEFEPPDDIIMILKTVDLSSGTVTDTTVSGRRAYWIEGASNLTVFGAGPAESRPSGNVLIWEAAGVGFRLESALTMDQAIAIAESMRPIAR